MAIPTFYDTSTFIKFDSPPTSSADYDYVSVYDGSMKLITQDGIYLTPPISFSNKTCIYVWGGIPVDYRCGQIKHNGVWKTGGSGYTTAVSFSLAEGDEVLVGVGNTIASAGGGSSS